MKIDIYAQLIDARIQHREQQRRRHTIHFKNRCKLIASPDEARRRRKAEL